MRLCQILKKKMTAAVFKDIFDHSINTNLEEREELITKFLEEDNLSEDEAIYKANFTILPKVRKTLKQLFVHCIIGMYEKRQTPLLKSILKKCKEFEKEGFTLQEAIKATVSYRKHQIYDLMDMNTIEADPDSD